MSRIHAFADLLRRYRQAFKAAWSARRALDPPPRLRHELAFLPASLELAETPVHPAPRWAMSGIALMALAAIAIAVLGRLDIVVSAKGKLVPTERVKFVQPAVTGIVRGIRVRDGQRVKAGDLLIELDATQAAADASKAHSSRVATALAVARATALLDAQRQNRAPNVALVVEADQADQKASQRLADGMIGEYRDKFAAARADLAKHEAELQSTRYQIEKLRATAPLARQQADDYKALIERKYVARTEYLDKEQGALQQEHELEVQRSRARELEAAVASQRSTLAGIASQFRREQLDALGKAQQQLSPMRDDETKARTRHELMTLKAPVDGTVQQLATHTLGGVVTTAQSLMEIVPDDAVEVEVSVENKDIGFVHRGQEAVVKIDAFPYTRYGFLQGRVTTISNDAVQDKKAGLMFMAHVGLPGGRMRVDEQWINLTPGMTVSVEIKTGRRSVAGYFLDPLVQTAQESLRER